MKQPLTIQKYTISPIQKENELLTISNKEKEKCFEADTSYYIKRETNREK